MKKLFLLIAIIALLISNGSFAQNNDFDKNCADYWLNKMSNPNLNYYELVEEFDQYWEGKTPDKNSGYKLFRRWQNWVGNYINPDGTLMPADHDLIEYEKFVKENPSDNIVGSWSLVGMTEFPEQYFGNQCPGLGRVSALAFHPTEPNTLFAGAPLGGIWKSTDGGTSWVNKNVDNFPTMGVSDIAVDFSNPNIIYIATGDRDGWASLGLGVYRSLDGGDTWTKKNTGMGNRTVCKLLISPNNHERLIAAVDDGIYISTNSGNSWSKVHTTEYAVRDMVFRPGNPNYIYASSGGVILKSTDQGDHWSPVLTTMSHRIVLAVTPANPEKLYAFGTKDSKFNRVYVSDNSGSSFISINSTGMEIEGQGSYNLDLAVSPTDESVLYAGMVNIYKSTDGGETWTMIANTGQIHADQHIFEWSPHFNNALFIGNDGGVYRVIFSGGFQVIQPISDGLAITQVMRLNTYAENPDLLICGTQDGGSYISDVVPWKHRIGGDGMNCEIDWSNPDIMYGSAQGGYICRSTDGGNSFQLIASKNVNGINQDGSWYSAFTIDKFTHSKMFAGFQDVWRSTNVTTSNPENITWTNISAGQINLDAFVDIIEQSPIDGNYIFISVGSRLFYTTNAYSAQVVWTEKTIAPSYGYVEDITPHPENRNIFYFAKEYGIYRYNIETDELANLTDNLNSFRKLSIAYHAGSNEGLYVGTTAGVFYKNADMENWMVFKTGLPPTNVFDLDINYHTDPPQLFAGTFGRGIWKTDIYANPKPNLSASNGQSTVTGTNVFMSCGYQNNSPMIGTGTYSVGFYLSNNNTISTSDILISEESKESLEPMATTNVMLLSTDVALITPEIPSGNYFMGVYLDNKTQVNELVENDNAFLATQKVTIPPPPAAPVNVTASQGEYNDKIRITWNPPPTGALAFCVYRNTTNNSGTAAKISGWTTNNWFEDLNAQPGIDYYYWLKASNYTQGLRPSTFSTVAIGWKTLAPPANVQASDGQFGDKVWVIWNAPVNGTNFMVYRNTVNNAATATPLGGTTWTTYNFFSDLTANPGVTYYYWVRAARSNTGQRPSDYSSFNTGWKAFASGPVPIASDGTFTDKVEITWNTVSGAYYYKLFFNNTNNPETSQNLTEWMAGTTSFTHNPNFAGVLYYYWVQASANAQGTNPTGYGQVDSGWKNMIPPTNVQATDGTLLEAVDVTWNMSNGALWYKVYRNSSHTWASAQPISNWIANRQFTDITATPGRDRYYWVKAASDTLELISQQSNWDMGWRRIASPVVSATKGVYPDKVEVSWQDVNGGMSYRVFREEEGTGNIEPLTDWDINLNSFFEDFTAVYNVRYFYSVKASANMEGLRESEPGIDMGMAAECGNLVEDIDFRQIDFHGSTLDITQRMFNEGPHALINPSQIAFALEEGIPFGDPDFMIGYVDIPALAVNEYFDIVFSVDLNTVPNGPVPQGTWLVSCFMPWDFNNCQTNLDDDYIVVEDQPFTITDAMYGIYTISPNQGDFSSIQQALLALETKGVSDNVTFHLDPLNYVEQLTLTAISGASVQKQITFMTNPAFADTAQIVYAPSESDNFTIRFSNATNFVFSNLKLSTNGFTNYQSNYGRVVEFVGNCENITIKNCLIKGYSDTYHRTYDNTVIYAENSNSNHITIKDNTILHGLASIYLIGIGYDNPFANTLIQGNVIEGFVISGITLKNAANPAIKENKLTSLASSIMFCSGIEVESSENGFDISANQIFMNSTDRAMYGILLNTINMTTPATGLLSNNFINIQSQNTYNYGFGISSVNDFLIYNNTIHIFGIPGDFSAGILINGPSNPTPLHDNQMINNIISNAVGGYCFVYSPKGFGDQMLTVSDYNNFYSTGPNLFFLNNSEDISTLGEWQIETGFEEHSLAIEAGLYSDTDLHSNSQALNGAGFPLSEICCDIDGDLRDPTTPDIGADEFDHIEHFVWTGAVSTDWHTAGNWEPLIVPPSSMNVLIPADRTNMPVIIAGAAYCKNLTLNGTLTIHDKTLEVGGDVEISGNLAMNHSSGAMNVNGNINWNNGSIATISDDATLRIYGNWNFNQGAQVQMNNGTVNFMGSQSKSIVVKSANCRFNNVIIRKTGNALIFFDESSTHSLDVKDLSIHYGAGLNENGSGDIMVRGFISNSGIMQLNGGTLTLAGDNHTIIPNTDSYFYNLRFNQTGDATIVDIFTGTITVMNDLTISYGVFHAGENVIKVGGNWVNEVGEVAFDQGTSRVVFNGSGANKDCAGGEIFNILEVDRPAGELINMHNVSCAVYDYTSGGINVPANKTFTALDLADNGLYGQFNVNEGSIMNLHQDAGQAVNLAGQIDFIGDGVINVFGGNGQSIWGQFGISSLNMSSGVLDFKNAGISISNNVSNPFTGNITGGTIRTSGGFSAMSPGFNPSGGTVELYGEGGFNLFSGGNSAFYNVMINKPDDYSTSTIYIIFSVIKNKLIVANGYSQVSTMINIECWNGIEVQDGGRLKVISGGVFMKNLANINIYGNGQLLLSGDLSGMSMIKGITPSDYFSLTVHSGGLLSANHTIFEGLSGSGIQILDGATIDPLNSFYNCTFGNGQSGPYPLLTIDNDQNLVIENAHFPENTQGGQYNVRKTVDQGSVNFTNASGAFAGTAFEDDPYNRIFWDDGLLIYHLNLPADWSGISSPIIPIDNALENVFSPIESKIHSVQSMTGVYIPGENLNTIGNWESHSAFKVKTTQACVLLLTGYYETNMTVSLNTGWNLLPVVTPDGAQAADLLSPVNGFVIAKDVAGTGIYWPEYGINTMEYLLPGKAYFVLLTENGAVNYAGFKSTFTGSKNLSASLDLTAFNIQATPISHTIAILPSAIETFDPGTLIGAYDQAGNCFGITKIGEGNNSITIFGDDPTTDEQDGFFEGEMVFFKTLTGFENLVGLEPTFYQNLPQSDGLFSENGLSAITSFKASTGIAGVNFLQNVKIFPNPSDGLVNISGIIPGTVLTVTDLQGKILMEKIADSDNTEFDLTGYQPGVYFVKISQNGKSIFRKIVLK
jgi:photosystem II stability/assembly factor-like uncharacterized protein